MLTRVRTAILLASACATALGDTLVIPNNRADTAGNMPVPFGGATRFQEIVGGGQFPGPIVITGIRFRSAVGKGPVSFNSPSMKITLSTTHAHPNTANGHALPSLTYADNVGPDAKTVFDGAVAGSSPGCSGPSPCPFDIAIAFTIPFSYDPEIGRLLVDLVTVASTGATSGSVDAVRFQDSSNSSVVLVTGDPTQATGRLTLGGIVLALDTSTAVSGPAVVGVRNFASGGAQLSPGCLASILGTNFGSVPVSRITVTVGGRPAYVFANASPTQLNVQIPSELSAGAATLIVTVNGAASAPFNLTLAPYAPAPVTQSATGSGPASVINAKNAFVTPALPASPGDQLAVFATGLGPTNPPTPTGLAAAAHPLATLPDLTVGGVKARVTYAGASAGFAGLFQVNFIVPPGVQGTQPLVLTAGGFSSSSSVTLPLFGLTSIFNNASFAPASSGTAAPGSFVTVYANGLGSTDQLTGFPAADFQGVRVTFNGIAAPLFHLVATAAPQQIDLLVPNELPTTGTVNVQLTTPAAQYPTYALKMTPASPGMYRIADPVVKTRSNVIAQFAGTAWLALPLSTTAALQAPACTGSADPLSLCGRPATIGDYLVIYATGLGLTTPNGDPSGKPLPTGAAPPADGSVLYQTPVLPTVTIGGIAANVLFSGLAPGFPGLYQVDVQVPGGVVSGDDVPVVLTMGTVSDTATISIQPRP